MAKQSINWTEQLMANLPGNQSYSPTVQQIAQQLKANPDFFNILGGNPGYSTEPMLTISNEIMSRVLAENMPWKWNREVIPPFLTVSLQQDYLTNTTDIGWLENGWRVDINNSTSNSNGAPKPSSELETVREIPQTATQSVPFNVSFIPNSQAFLGSWQANTEYGCGYGVAQLPRSPIQQFKDVNGNLLFIDSTQLGLTIESPGYTGTTLPLPANAPYGISGSVQPAAPPNATPGSTVQDGSVVWTVADSINGYSLRLKPVPALNGLCWYIVVQYQQSPPLLTSLQSTFAPIPNQMMYLIRAGIRAALYRENGNPQGQNMYATWEEVLMKAVRAADRQTDDWRLYPEQSIMGGISPYQDPLQIGAAWPFGPQPLG